MKIAAVTIELIAPDDATLVRMIATIVPPYNDRDLFPPGVRMLEPVIRDAQLYDEDAFFGSDAPFIRALDYLQRCHRSLVMEITNEVLNFGQKLATNDTLQIAESIATAFDERDLSDHLQDLYADRILEALANEFPDEISTIFLGTTLDFLIDWTATDAAIEDLRLTEDDLGAIRMQLRYIGVDEPLAVFVHPTFVDTFIAGADFTPRLSRLTYQVRNWVRYSAMYGVWLDPIICDALAAFEGADLHLDATPFEKLREVMVDRGFSLDEIRSFRSWYDLKGN